MKRSAFGEWRCAGATSPGRRYWTATESVCVLVRSGTPGLARRRIRLSVPCPGATKSALRRRSGSISTQRQKHGWTRVFFDSMSGPGRDHGASRPAARTSARYSSSSSPERVACSAMLFWRHPGAATIPPGEAGATSYTGIESSCQWGRLGDCDSLARIRTLVSHRCSAEWNREPLGGRAARGVTPAGEGREGEDFIFFQKEGIPGGKEN